MSESEDPKAKKHSLKVLGPDEANLSELSVEELKSLKEAILTRARQRVGPEGFNPVMQDTSQGYLPLTGDDFLNPMDKYILVASIVNVILVASTGVTAAVSWLAAASVLNGANAERYGTAVIGVSGFFSLLFVLSALRTMMRPVAAKNMSSGG